MSSKLINKNSRIYSFTPTSNSLKLDYNERYIHAFFEYKNIHLVLSRAHARGIRKKTGFKDIVTGDIFYDKLYWTFDHENYTNKTGMAIVRNEKIIWYAMPGIPDGLGTRRVMTEKRMKITGLPQYVTDGMLRRAHRINR